MNITIRATTLLNPVVQRGTFMAPENARGAWNRRDEAAESGGQRRGVAAVSDATRRASSAPKKGVRHCRLSAGS